MLGLLTRLISGAVTPLTDQVADIGARLLRKLALFCVAAVCLVVVLIALTVALDLWVASHAGAIVGALSVAGLYLALALVAIGLAMRDRPQMRGRAGDEEDASSKAASAGAEHASQIDDFTAPLLALLQKFGLRREQLAVLAGASVAKQIGPLPLVGLAILGGFLIGRMATGWRSLLSLDALSEILSSSLFGGGDTVAPETKD